MQSNKSGAIPKYACPCLNVKIYPIAAGQFDSGFGRAQIGDAPPSVAGWEAARVDSSSIQIAYEQLTLRSRSSEHGLHLLCHLCNILVYRIVEDSSNRESSASNMTSSAAIPASLMSPATRERVDFQKLFQKDKDNKAWIQVKTKDACITGRELEDALSKASPVFGLSIPIIESVSPSPTPPTSTVPLPSPSTNGGPSSTTSGAPSATSNPFQLVVNWPEFIPPPPFVPSHPLYAHLARIAKKSSSKRRSDAEETIRSFIVKKQAEVAEYEADLKRQVNTVWRLWRDSSEKDKEKQSGNANAGSLDPILFDPRVNTKRHSSNMSTSSTTSASGTGALSMRKPAVIREFQEVSSVSPRTSEHQYVPSSSYSPSTATPRVQPRMSALGTSLVQSGMHMPHHLNASPVKTTEPSVSRKDPTANPASLTPPSANIFSRVPSERIQKHRTIEVKKVKLPEEGVKAADVPARQDQGTPQPKANGTGKKKGVTFSSQEHVVTVARDIRSEKLQKLSEEHAKGEEAMFDLDVEGEEREPAAAGAPSADIAPDVISNKPSNHTISGYVDEDEEEDIPAVSLSFKNRTSKYTMARSLPKPRTGIFASTSLADDSRISDALKVQGPHAYTMQEPSALASSPAKGRQNELVKLMAGQTPTHRSAWKTGTLRVDEEQDDDDDGSDTEQEEEEAGARGMDIAAAPSAANHTNEKQVVSKSMPRDIPAMRTVQPSQQSRAVDNDFEGAMSKSYDPGPALELLAGESQEDDEEEGIIPNITNGTDVVEADENEDPERAELMRKLMQGTGSFHAQKILAQTSRAVPDSMWRSMA